MYTYLGYLVVLLSCLAGGLAQRTRDKMYDSLTGSMCFRRLNATHQTGCSSDFGGSVGALHLIREQQDFEFLFSDPPAPPYTAVIVPYLFTRENILKLRDNAAKLINGIILINNSTGLDDFSHESRCPNQFGGLLEKQTCDARRPETAWNPFGTNLLHESFPFPVLYVTEASEVAKLVKCFENFNKDVREQAGKSLCAVQIKSFMMAAGNSEICMRRTKNQQNLASTRYCDPLQSKNVYATLFPRPKVDENGERKPDLSERFILVSARMDTTSMFDGLYVGAMGSVVPFATLIATGHYLAGILPNKESTTNNVLFLLFNGETYDYIGSQKFVYDLQKGLFPAKATHSSLIGMENIDLMVDLGTLDDPQQLKVYHPTRFTEAKRLLDALQKYNTQHSLDVTAEDRLEDNLPPFSAQSFLRENLSFPAVMVTSKPLNKFYHSVYDDAEYLNFTYRNASVDFTQLDDLLTPPAFTADQIQAKIRNVSTLLGMGIYELVTNREYGGSKAASSHLIDEFLYCFLVSANCSLFKAASRPDALEGMPFPPSRYVGVHAGTFLDEAVGWTYRIVGFLFSQKTKEVKDNCTHLPLSWFAGVDGTGECRITTHNFTNAVSPAFLDDEYDWSSNRYSTWTESTWDEVSARIFLRPARSHEAFTLAIGFIVMTIAFVLVFLINSRSDVLFDDSISNTPIAPPANC